MLTLVRLVDSSFRSMMWVMLYLLVCPKDYRGHTAANRRGHLSQSQQSLLKYGVEHDSVLINRSCVSLPESIFVSFVSDLSRSHLSCAASFVVTDLPAVSA